MKKFGHVNGTPGAGQPEWKLKFIRENCATMPAKVLAEKLEVSKTFIYNYCGMNNLPLKRKKFLDDIADDDLPQLALKKGIIRSNRKESGPISRPEAKYNNRTHDDLINYYLSL